MSQMRKDVFTGRWVIMAETTTVRPSDFHFKRFAREKRFCPFCETNEASTPPEVFAIRKPSSSPNGVGWSMRVVPNFAPRLRIEGQLGQSAEGFPRSYERSGLIIAETPCHDRSLHELEIHDHLHADQTIPSAMIARASCTAVSFRMIILRILDLAKPLSDNLGWEERTVS